MKKQMNLKVGAMIVTLLAGMSAKANIATSVECQITKTSSAGKSVSREVKKLMVSNEEGGLSRASLYKDSAIEVSAYSSDYRQDSGDRLFIKAKKFLVSAEAVQSDAKISLNSEALNIEVSCHFVK